MITIGMTGAGGVGKGTLARGLINELENRLGETFIFIPSPVQSIGKMLSPYSKAFDRLPLNMKLLLQYSSMMSQIKMEVLLRRNYKSYVAERSLIDYIPYMREAFLGTEYDKYIPQYEKIISDQLHSCPYDYLIYLPIEFKPTVQDLTKNSWKERDEASRENTDRIIRSCFEESGCKNIIKTTGNLDERLLTCMNEIIASTV